MEDILTRIVNICTEILRVSEETKRITKFSIPNVNAAMRVAEGCLKDLDANPNPVAATLRLLETEHLISIFPSSSRLEEVKMGLYALRHILVRYRDTLIAIRW